MGVLFILSLIWALPPAEAAPPKRCEDAVLVSPEPVSVIAHPSPLGGREASRFWTAQLRAHQARRDGFRNLEDFYAIEDSLEMLAKMAGDRYVVDLSLEVGQIHEVVRRDQDQLALYMTFERRYQLFRPSGALESPWTTLQFAFYVMSFTPTGRDLLRANLPHLASWGAPGNRAAHPKPDKISFAFNTVDGTGARFNFLDQAGRRKREIAVNLGGTLSNFVTNVTHELMHTADDLASDLFHEFNEERMMFAEHRAFLAQRSFADELLAEFPSLTSKLPGIAMSVAIDKDFFMSVMRGSYYRIPEKIVENHFTRHSWSSLPDLEAAP